MDELIKTAKVFSDKNRVLIYALILKYKEVCVCEICDTLKLSQPLVSRHLKQMKQSGIISSKQEGKWCVYSINTTFLPDIAICYKKEVKKSIIPILPKLLVCKKR